MKQPKRPGVIGRWTNDIVYSRLAPDILDKLGELNPKNEKGVRKSRHHQWLTENIGHPRLKRTLIGFMRSSSELERFLQKAPASLS